MQVSFWAYSPSQSVERHLHSGIRCFEVASSMSNSLSSSTVKEVKLERVQVHNVTAFRYGDVLVAILHLQTYLNASIQLLIE